MSNGICSACDQYREVKTLGSLKGKPLQLCTSCAPTLATDNASGMMKIIKNDILALDELSISIIASFAKAVTVALARTINVGDRVVYTGGLGAKTEKKHNLKAMKTVFDVAKTQRLKGGRFTITVYTENNVQITFDSSLVTPLPKETDMVALRDNAPTPPTFKRAIKVNR